VRVASWPCQSYLWRYTQPSPRTGVGMSLERIRGLIPVSDADLVPSPRLYLHKSYLHGQDHVARVMVHALRLVDATDAGEEAARLWAAVYLHDIARRHDGPDQCRRISEKSVAL